LRDRLEAIDLGESGFKIDKHVASIASTCISALEDKGKSTLGIKAREHFMLMMVCNLHCNSFALFLIWICFAYVSGSPVYNTKLALAGA
jgi:hypothetical protein